VTTSPPTHVPSECDGPQRGGIIWRQRHESSGRTHHEDTAAHSEAVWAVPNHAIALRSAPAARVDGPAAAPLLECHVHVASLGWPVEIVCPDRRHSGPFYA